jgi:hypothetical protein
MKRCFLACALALFGLPLMAAAPVEKIQSLLTKQNVLCGRFDQSKQLAGFKRPLLSNGRFCVVTNKGVLWRTLQPFPNTLRLTREEIVQTQGERVAMRLDARQEPTVRAINGVLFALLIGDLSQLDGLFETDGSVHGKNWNVTLKPREPGLARILGNIQLDGGRYVKNIAIIEANGDRTSIVFSDMVSGDAALSADEAKSFD